MPVVVAFLLESLYPEVGHAHGHAVVEADATVAEGQSQTRHAAHFLGYGYGVRPDLVYELVGQREVDYGVGVLASVVVVGISAEGFSQAVVVVQHRCDTVEAEAVEMEFLEPVFAVGEQEMQHFILSVVETQRVPCGVVAPRGVVVEILVGSAVEASETFVLVFYGVAVDNVHNHGNAPAVGVVDQRLEFGGGAEAAGRREETAHMISEAAVVGMFLDGHDLDGVVAVGGDARQHVGAELLVAAYLLFLLCHAYVAFIDQQRSGVGAEIGVGPCEMAVRGIHFGGEYVCVGVLHHTVGIGGNAFAASAVPVHHHFIPLPVADGFGRERGFPDTAGAVVDAVQGILGSLLPAVEIANEVYGGGVGSPFAEGPAVAAMAVQAEVAVGVGEVGERAGVACKLLLLAHGIGMSAFYGCGVGFEPAVVLEYVEFLSHLLDVVM